MEFKNRLKQLRQENNITQAELAHQLNYGRTAIANYEAGRSEPSFETLTAIANFFDVSIDYLLGNTIVRNPPDTVALHAEYDHLPEEAIKEIEYHIAWVKEKYKKDD